MSGGENQRLKQYRRGEANARRLAKQIEKELPGMVFVLHYSIPNPDGGLTYAGYISNGHRADMIRLMRETADTVEAKMDVGPGMPIPTGRA